MSLLLPDALLVLSLLFVRPAAALTWRWRLLAHALLLAAFLMEAALSAQRPELAVVGMLAATLEAGLAWWLLRGEPDEPGFKPRSVAWLAAGLVLVGLSVRLLPDAALPPFPRGLMSASIAMLLTGLLGALAADRAVARFGSLLLAGNGLVMAACELPGMTLLSLACILLIQASLFASLLQAWGRAVPGPRTGRGAPP